MGICLESLSTEIFCAVISVLWMIYWYLTKNYDYWKKRGVPNKEPEFPFGSLKEIWLTRTFIGKGHENIYKQFPNERYYGIIEFRDPALVIKDPELIKKVMVKDFNHFVDRPILMTNPNEKILLHLLNLVGHEWKMMRAKLTPTFSSGKMKQMFELMEECSRKLKDKLEVEGENGKTVDAKEILARFTMEIISSCAFGIEVNSLSDKNAKFFQVFGGVVKTSLLRYIKRIMFIFFPPVMKFFRVNMMREELKNFVMKMVKDTVEYRQKNNVKRNDFIDLMMNIKHSKSEVEQNGRAHSENSSSLTIEQMAAQAFVFFFAGFETSSSLMSFCLFELSRHQDIQQKLYQEIREVLGKHEEKITYQALMEMPFMEQVINETLRLYGTAHALSRVCTQPYTIPDSDLTLDKGMKVIIPLYALHHDPEYFPEPHEFRPERFSPAEVNKRHPYTFMPFGEGPRNCIGMRFGLVQARIGLATVILNFRVELSPEQEVPIEIHKRTVVILPANPVRLKFHKRKQ